MSKVVLNDVGVILQATNTINTNNSRIENAIENTLSRDGTAPNEMNAVLDMNDHRIINLPLATTVTEPVRLGEIQDIVSGLTGIAEGGTTNQVLHKTSNDRYDTGWVTLDKAYIGLNNVDNTSDVNKPISTATQTALDLKAPLASPALTGTPTAPTAATNDNSTQIATTAYVKANTALLQPLDSDLTTIAGLTATTDNFIQSKSGAWASRTVAQVRTDLSATRPAFSVHKNGTDQTGIVPTTGATLTWSTEFFDIGGFFTSNAWTPPAGVVQLHATALLSAGLVDGQSYYISIFKNGVQFKVSGAISAAAGATPLPVSVNITDIANGTDVYSVSISGTTGTSVTVYGGAAYTYFTGSMI